MIPSEGAIPLNLLRSRDGASGITSTRSSANACVVNLDKPLLTTLYVITSTPGGTDILTLANSPLPPAYMLISSPSFPLSSFSKVVLYNRR